MRPLAAPASESGARRGGRRVPSPESPARGPGLGLALWEKSGGGTGTFAIPGTNPVPCGVTLVAGSQKSPAEKSKLQNPDFQNPRTPRLDSACRSLDATACFTEPAGRVRPPPLRPPDALAGRAGDELESGCRGRRGTGRDAGAGERAAKRGGKTWLGFPTCGSSAHRTARVRRAGLVILTILAGPKAAGA
jgi:hypothetical protein